ncbi:hypothetical protein E1301_Tti020934 [Triplophysa tibetana]|uniref:Uncharacterized protein n=1 Tax=Triplophysa tibetana TaxID=1572043 RepID=A0A5A9N059_9TELE|nr:hypothetical protein E1301_Tti020934 [Triplophysa tibetana]
MTIDEVRNGTKTALTYLIKVNMHKTNQAFGPPQIALSAQEYSWFEQFLEMKDVLARNNWTVEDRLKMLHFMCHDTQMADKCYACNLNNKVLEGPDVPNEPVCKSIKKRYMVKKMEREVTMGKLRELEASNPAIPMVTLKDEPQGNSGTFKESTAR